jgi:hypothetical protein
MKSTELRIGNYGYIDGAVSELHGINYDVAYAIIPQGKIVATNVYTLKPIPLTEEWLLKFGFENWGTDEYGYMNYVLHNVIDGTSNFVIGLSDDDPIPMIDNDLCCWSEFKYVHTLQNLYFALTGEELKIKDI